MDTVWFFKKATSSALPQSMKEERIRADQNRKPSTNLGNKTEVTRRLVHTRTVEVSVYRRTDDLWEIEADLRDVKTHDYLSGGRITQAGFPLHQMQLKLTVNADFDVIAARAQTFASPYPGYCDELGDKYGALVGLNLARGFGHAVKERLQGTLGCTHLSELARMVTTAAIIGIRGELQDAEYESDAQPAHLDRCHALRLDGPVVLKYYPRWARPSAESADNGSEQAIK